MAIIGYIRQSRRADLDVALSHDAQLAAIRRKASEDGVDPDSVEILADMGRSGARGKKRPAYAELVARVKRGEVDTVYALSMSRLARSVVELHTFFDVAKAHDVRIVFEKDRFDLTTTTGRLNANVLAAVYEFERDLAVERARDNVAIRRGRGDAMGRRPYGDAADDDPEAVVAAFQEAGTLNGAALLLNRRKVKPHTSNTWHGTSVKLVLARHAPHLVPRNVAKGARPSSSVGFTLYRLLRCACGRTLTASRDGRGNRDVVYRCHMAVTLAEHHRPYRVREQALMPWIRAEAERFRPDFSVARNAATEAERAALEDQRRQVGDALLVRAYTREQAAAKVEEIEAKLAALEDVETVADVEPLDWNAADPAEINRLLSIFWTAVILDDQMQPVRAEWRPGFAEYLS